MNRYNDLVNAAIAELKEAKPKKKKYRNEETDGYPSNKEAHRARDLKMMERQCLISNLLEQVSFELIPKQNGERAVHYIADFTYNNINGEYVVEDCKGMRTPAYVIKRKLMLYVHGIRIKET